MTNIPNNRNEFERQGTDPNKEGGAIAATNFGGLNTVSNPLAVPYEDSPLLLNALVDVSGAVEKRKGTKVVRRVANAAQGGAIVPVTTLLGYTFQIVKNGIDLSVYELRNDSMNLLMTKANVWSEAARYVKPTYTTTNEAESRIIFCTGVNVPVQLLLSEYRAGVTATAGQTAFTLSTADRLQTATTTNALVYVDRSLVGVSSISYNSSTREATVTLSNGLTAGNHVIDVIVVTWQWWAEASVYYGDRFFDTANRYHDKQTDVNVAIPENLRDELRTYPDPTLAFAYPLAVYRWNPTTNVFDGVNQNVSKKPNGVYEYSCSDGAARNANEPVNPSPFFLTFGARDINWNKPGIPDTAYICRRRLINFNGGNGVKGSYFYILRDNIVQSQSWSGKLNPNYGDYRLYNSKLTGTGAYFELTNTTALADMIDFSGGSANDIGIPANSRIRLINGEVKYVGSNALTTNVPRTDGNWLPCYGISNFANYQTGSFPRNVAMFQGRLVFSGFPQNPLAVCFSSTTDSTVPGEYYASFQQDAFTTLDSDPFDVLINSSADDYVTGMVEYQGSFFIFTRKGVFRVTAPNRGVVTQANALVVSVASIGLVNPQSLIKAEDTVIFLADDGVYTIINGSSMQETTEYRLEELSTKIRNQFGITKDPNKETFAWVAFDNTERLLFVALPDTTNRQFANVHFVFSTFRQAWSKFDTPGGFNSLGAATCIDTATQSSFVMMCTQLLNTDGTAKDNTYLKFHANHYIDWATTTTSTGIVTVDLPLAPTTSYTTKSGVRNYKTGFFTLPILEVQDVTVTLDGVPLAFGTDYVKLPNGVIRLIANPGTGKTLTIRYRRPDGNHNHVAVYVDRVGTEDYAISHSSDRSIVTIAAPVNTKVKIGTLYTTVYQTPLFTWGTLQRYKRLLHWMGFFDNRIAQETWELTDVNTASNQDAEQIVGLPKHRLDCNITFLYNSEQSGDTSSDLYGFEELVWDVGLFDTYLPLQTEDYVMLRQALQGVGYSFQGMIWSTDDSAFRMVGYQLEGKMKGNKYLNRPY